MLKKNRIVGTLLSAVMCVGLLAGCGSAAAEEIGDDDGNGKKSVVCTIFPEYDWAREIIGTDSGQYELTLLLDNGVDLHSYQPTAEDIAQISACDVFIYVGGESDGWVSAALKEASNKEMQVINLLDVLGDTVKEEEFVEGMQAEEEEEDGEATGQDSSEEDSEAAEKGPEYDEHVWLSLKNAGICVNAITEALKKADEKNADIFQTNCDAYVEKLDGLDQEYAAAVSEGTQKTLLFGDRFPFRYLVDDYNLDYYAAFVGCSAETEASFETIVFLAGKVDELGLSHVMVIENSDRKIAQTVINNTAEKSADILVLDSMQSVTSRDIAEGETYLSVMENNLNVLRIALN